MTAGSKEVHSAAIREQLSRILSSSGFTSSERMSRFLRFAVEMSLAGRAAELKEYLIGVEVFDRSPSFDPRIDPIVRVEARRLRSKLKAYYEGPGRADELLIEFPTGGYVPRWREQSAAPHATPEPPASTDVAVLPFANLSGDPESDYFSDGLTEELIHTLTKVEALRVVAWTTAVKFKDRQEEFRRIGEELKVGAILAGSVRRSGDRLRITARLVDTSAGCYIWSEVYDRRLEDLFAIQQELASAIAASLKVKLLGSPAEAVKPNASSLAAYDLYLRGRFHWNKRTPEGFDLAIQYFEEALAAKPDFAPALAGIADAHSLRADHAISAPAEVMPQARAAALRALELDPNLAEAHTSLGLILSLYDWNWPAAAEHYRRAIRLNPGYATARHWYGCDYLALIGRFDEAVEQMCEAVRLDPLSNLMAESLGYVMMLAGRYDEALEYQMEALELAPHFYKSYGALGRLYISMGMYDDAIEMLHKAQAIAGDAPTPLGALGQAYALGGRVDDARAALARLNEMRQSRFVPSTSIAMVHASLGEKEVALDWLEAAAARRELTICALNVHPAYVALRAEPRFAALVRRIGLADVTG